MVPPTLMKTKTEAVCGGLKCRAVGANGTGGGDDRPNPPGPHDFDRLGPVYSSNIAMLLLAPLSGFSYGPVKLCRRHSQALAFFFMS